MYLLVLAELVFLRYNEVLNSYEQFGRDHDRTNRKCVSEKINSCGLAKMSIPFYTARDAQKALGITGMAEIYEKARYSGIPCTEEDVRQMKNKLR